MRAPRWNDPIGSACEEAEPVVLRGLPVRPTLYGFEDGEPTVRVQPGLAVLGGDVDHLRRYLTVLAPVLGVRQLLVFSQARTTDPTAVDDDLRAALATYGLTVEVARRDGDEVTTDGHLLDRRIVDSQVRWDAPLPMPQGLWTETLEAALDPDAIDVPADLDAAGIAYALSRAGVVVEVATGWRDRYGFDGLPHRSVRAVDRRRARTIARSRPRAAARSGTRTVRS